ncbi:BatD family protein, partial [Oleiphilus sp. HI0079]
MVNRVPFLSLRANLLALLFLLGNALSASAATELNLSVDKNKLYQNEILNLTVQVNSELDFSLGGLMNFGGAQVESPSFEGIEQDWEIIDKQQSYNMQSINGK